MPIEEYLRLRERPPGRPAMYQRWRDLTFLHFSLPPEELRPFIPAELSIETFPNAEGQERAYVGLVPFRMEGIRPRGMPALPGISAFPETNVRTYVHREGRDPGVWFFSLDASKLLAVTVGRSWFKLPYLQADMKTRRHGEEIEYWSRRKKGSSANLDIQIVIGPDIAPPEPGSLEFFLVERYLLYSLSNERLRTGRVYHKPYPLRAATVGSCTQGLVQAHGLPCGNWEHVCFSAGVDVEVFSLKH